MVLKSTYGSVLILLFLLCQSGQAESLRVTPDWLNTHLHDSNIVILDARSEDAYLKNHIVGAINLPESLTYQQNFDGGMIVEPDVMQKLLRERGVDRQKLVLIYDGGKLVDAARVFWALEVYSFPTVKIMSPGFKGWVMNKYSVTQEIPNVVASKYIPNINHHRIASKFATQLAIANPNEVVVDARKIEAYRGETSTAKRFGHIPTALSYPVVDNFQDENDLRRLRDLDDLKDIYKSLPKHSNVILYCENGLASAMNYLVLRELGYNVSNYDGAWREWANDFTLPIEK